MTPYPMDTGDPAKMGLRAAHAGDRVRLGERGEGVCFFGELISIGKERRAWVHSSTAEFATSTGIGELGFPVYAQYRTPVQSIGRWKVVESGVPVPMPGATVSEVEVTQVVILADSDGAIVVPAPVARRVLELAEARGREVQIRAELADGLSCRKRSRSSGIDDGATACGSSPSPPRVSPWSGRSGSRRKPRRRLSCSCARRGAVGRRRRP